MAEFTLMAGGKFNTLTQEELSATLSQLMMSWRTEILRSGKPRKFWAQGTVASTAVSIAPGGDNTLGPGPGMVWSVKSITITGLGTTDFLDLYVDSDPFCSLSRPTNGDLADKQIGSDELVLMPGGTLRFVGSGLSATGQITAYGRCWEVPIELLSSL